MKTMAVRVGILVGATVLMIAFQNCSKIGTNGIGIEEKALSLDQIEIVDQPAPLDPSPVKPPSQGEGSESVEQEEVVVENPDMKGPEVKGPEAEEEAEVATVEVEDEEVADAVGICSKESESQGFHEGQKIRVVHGKADYSVDQVKDVTGVHSTIVLRAATAESKVIDARNVQGTLVLCGFSKIEKLDAVQGKVIVVGGEIAKAKLVHSTLVIVDAKIGDQVGVMSVVKSYSQK